MNRHQKHSRVVVGLLSIFLMVLMFGGCASDTETPQPTTTKTTATGTVTADNAGVVAAATAVSVPQGNTLTIQAGTTLTEDSAGVFPVTGDIETVVSYSTKEDDLPASAMTLPDGATLASFLDIYLGAVKCFSKPLKAVMNVASGGAIPGTIVAFYTFNDFTEAWEPIDNATVAEDGTASLSIHHLSVWAAFITDTPPPGKPSKMSASAGNAKVTVSWSAPKIGPAPTSYNLYYSDQPGITKDNALFIENVTSPYDVVGLTNGTPYYFAVTAVNADGEGGFSSEETATPDESLQPPATPNGVVVTTGLGAVTVQWNTKLYATSYNIYYLASSSITSEELVNTGDKVTVAADPDPQPVTQTVEIDGLTPGTVYSFVVTAENASGESGPQTSPKKATPN